ncbi:MAG: HD domain-containing protein [Alphaproteobacteria bacterium]|nr:HD domain-containing protein [Alphaproteobacteria bacterium]
MSHATVDLMRAVDFAARRHVAHRRKGATSDPYVNHLAEVACLLAEATDGQDPALVIAGLLHDCVEDTETTGEEIAQAFGPDVAALVLEVTDEDGLSSAERKQRQVDTAAKKSDRAKMLKLADKTSNLRSMIADPPADWSPARRCAYVDWAEQVVSSCRGVNAQLEAWFDEAVEGARASLTAAAAD